ncbi:mitochondrial inner membrane protease ATP23 homolog [Diorhabda carinulata]|uniref:mitochondrial inner membrane protease ATP23 homolog n=1 Tax=Diorhabda carinulata TaxID=1163345 RepID=UPI0025A1F1EA|nr:mitochondrial inner membrane protease ATP23 homolog [Diorhabda carinulata]
MTLIGNFEKESEKNDNQQKQTTSLPSDASQWGYDLYPSRKSRSETAPSFIDYMKGKGKENFEKIKCERNVYKCIKDSPIVKLMMGALKASGCGIDIRRHISCEECAPTVSGGYDPIMNQVIICQNTARKEGIVQAVLTHEMIHMFDYCKNDLDFKNLEHLACTEIRAANLAHCSFMSALFAGDASLFYVKEAHQNCVKNKALSSVLSARNVSKEEAMIAINKVFSKCYSDLEPIGRRIRRNSMDMQKAYEEGYYYGYNL